MVTVPLEIVPLKTSYHNGSLLDQTHSVPGPRERTAWQPTINLRLESKSVCKEKTCAEPYWGIYLHISGFKVPSKRMFLWTKSMKSGGLQLPVTWWIRPLGHVLPLISFTFVPVGSWSPHQQLWRHNTAGSFQTPPLAYQNGEALMLCLQSGPVWRIHDVAGFITNRLQTRLHPGHVDTVSSWIITGD